MTAIDAFTGSPMTSLLDYLFGAASFVPHGVCLLWRPDLVAMHAVSDALIALAYFAIPVGLWRFLRRRRDLDEGSRRVIMLFSLFIFACGVTHTAGLVTLWVPAYGAQGLLKAVTAAISIFTMVVFWRQIPALLALPTPAQLRKANDQLARINRGLEETIAYRRFDLTIAADRIKDIAASGNVTAFAQNTRLDYIWTHHPSPEGGALPEHRTPTDRELLPEPLAAAADAVKRRVLESGRSEIARLGPLREGGDGERRVWNLRVRPTTDMTGEPDGVFCTLRDISRESAQEATLADCNSRLKQLKHRYDLALESARITVFEQDTDLRYRYVHNTQRGHAPDDYLGKTDAELFSEADCFNILPIKTNALQTGERQRIELDINSGLDRRTIRITIDPCRDADGTITGIIGTSEDLTSRRKMEDRLRLTMRELNHLSETMLATVRSLAEQTAASTATLDAFMRGFSARLRALAVSQELLASRSWYGAELAQLLRAHLGEVRDTARRMVRIDGPPLHVNADTAQELGLFFHDLLAHAVQHGSLSVATGSVDVHWEIRETTVCLTWQERNAPEHLQERDTQPPTCFTAELWRQRVKTALAGTIAAASTANGLSCTITFPTDRLVGG
ncbi:sensor histidine kinase [Stappia indica]|uniref:sensor histidine kinase n=1 Tax=Stappia indica TaxID=538381 RepID=UPI001CD79F12|nr:PAS domain-containing protein [Stappia indica]MCA1298932.1 PAS domain-containing protein [Stappia indica]